MRGGVAMAFHLNNNKGQLSGLPPLLLAALNGMDEQGETILGTWLYGGGGKYEVEDESWTKYMMKHVGLRNQIFVKLAPAVKKIADRKKLGRFPILERFHAEFSENSDFSGYALLHGTNKTVGDFVLSGWAEVQEAVHPVEGDYDIEMDLRFTFNDIVDPNGKYWMDRARSILAKIVTLGSPRDYRLSIYWGSSCLAEVRKGNEIFFSGYPSENRRGIRPLPEATLDWEASEKRYAKETETKIVAQLQRNISPRDVASLADRKRRLLWLFYRLSGYWGGTYLYRLNTAAGNDELVSLVRQRVSTELRAEIVSALRGKRPQGPEPT
jgi:hypothetical protein